MISPTARNQQFRRLTVEGADWVSSPGGVYSVPPASTANGISATLTNALNTAGDPIAMGCLAWRMFDQYGQLVQGGDDNRYLFEWMFYVRTAAADLSLAACLMGLANQSTASKFTTGGTAGSTTTGITYSGATGARSTTQYRITGGANTVFSAGAVGGYASIRPYSYTRITKSSGYQTRVDNTYDTTAGAYQFDDSTNLQGVVLSPVVAPNAYRIILALGSFGGPLVGNQPIEVDCYYSATKIVGGVPT